MSAWQYNLTNQLNDIGRHCSVLVSKDNEPAFTQVVKLKNNC